MSTLGELPTYYTVQKKLHHHGLEQGPKAFLSLHCSNLKFVEAFFQVSADW